LRQIMGLMIISLLLMTGCWDMTDINQAVIISGVGVDYRNNKVIYIHQIDQKVSQIEEGAGRPLTESIISQGRTFAEAARSANLSSSNYFLLGQIDLIMVGEDLAQTDMNLFSDFILRNRYLRLDTYMVLAVNDTPEKVYAEPMPLTAFSAMGMKNLLDNNEVRGGVFVPVTMLDFLGGLSTAGIQPVLPQISLSEGKVMLKGTAVFKERKWVGSLNEEESRGYRWLHYKTKYGGMLIINSPVDKQAVLLEVNNFSSKIKPVIKNGQLKFDITVDTSLHLYEQSGSGNLMTEKQRREMEKLANREIERQIKACLDKSQSLNSDILGLGLQTYRYYPEYWQEVEKDWPSIFPKVKADITVKSKVAGGHLAAKPVKLRS